MRLILAVLIAAAASAAQGGWTFCVAESGQDVWISSVFTAHNREGLEAEFTALLRARGVAHADTQCPQPQSDKMEAFNAQFIAAEFHRKLGQKLHAVAFVGGAH